MKQLYARLPAWLRTMLAILFVLLQTAFSLWLVQTVAGFLWKAFMPARPSTTAMVVAVGLMAAFVTTLGVWSTIRRNKSNGHPPY
ncbi:hypothetical protein EJV47_00305 [Hymenobacter gummosus]|uniref:Uncharacterized protein n=1 Tax=Hymenobacter gummosus TaxID=1776032 RepID=A0A431U7J2_9BACT|nr:hypothetical protein [Hymenobacter gummosus]RTQ53220.1 hypothetical protein EJV47_00305 [Hymenobacter gummosus]